MAEKFLDDGTISQVREHLNQLENPVEMLLFTKKKDCRACDDTQQLAEEVSALSDKLTLKVYDLEQEKDLATQYNVDKAPMIVIAAKDGGTMKDYGLRYAGLPGGHEFGTFINDLVAVSKGDSGLGKPMRDYLSGLKEPVKMMVFFTPSCPHCPKAVSLAHQMAIESPLVQAEAIAANDFYELSNEFDVSGVPHTAVLDSKGGLLHTVVGGVAENYMLEELKKKLN